MSAGDEELIVDVDDIESPRRNARAWLRSHPLVVVGALTGAIAVGHAIWLWNHRLLGGIDPDESGYIATALRYQRSIDLLHPLAFVREVGGTGTGPLVPLLSVPLLILGPRNVHTAMLVLPLLMVAGAVFVAGIANRLAGPVAAIAAGVAWALLPTVVLATQTYWLGLGTATCAAGSMWALVTSDGGRNRRIWWYGFFLGCMLLARTMALAFVPGLAIAGLIVTGLDRRRLLRLVGAGGVAFAVAGPWWIVEWNTIFDYLLGYGYGPRAGLFGQGNALERVGFRISRMTEGVGQPLASFTLVAALVGVCVLAWSWVARRERTEEGRLFMALAVAVAAGIGALASTTNNGVWFELPMVALVVPLAVGLAAKVPRRIGGLCAVPLLGMAAVQLPVAWWWVPPTTHGVDVIAVNQLRGAQYEDGFAQYDERFATARRSEQATAAADWWALARAVEAEMATMADRRSDTDFTLSGNMVLLNSNTLTLAAELDGWGARISIPDTTKDRTQRAAQLSPTTSDGRFPRVLVLALHDRILFTPDAEVARFAREARAAGWVLHRRFAMPGSGAVEILVHPDTARG